jgi:hypothetical protein
MLTRRYVLRLHGDDGEQVARYTGVSELVVGQELMFRGRLWLVRTVFAPAESTYADGIADLVPAEAQAGATGQVAS